MWCRRQCFYRSVSLTAPLYSLTATLHAVSSLFIPVSNLLVSIYQPLFIPLPYPSAQFPPSLVLCSTNTDLLLPPQPFSHLSITVKSSTNSFLHHSIGHESPRHPSKHHSSRPMQDYHTDYDRDGGWQPTPINCRGYPVAPACSLDLFLARYDGCCCGACDGGVSFCIGEGMGEAEVLECQGASFVKCGGD